MDYHDEAFLATLMRRQLRLSIACAACFLVALLGLPLLNYFAPDLMAVRIFGFTLTWFVLGVGFFPAVWLIAWVFIRRSLALEEEEVRQALEKQNAPDAGAMVSPGKDRR
jgi:putative solute:sodium symporter small subunit